MFAKFAKNSLIKPQCNYQNQNMNVDITLPFRFFISPNLSSLAEEKNSLWSRNQLRITQIAFSHHVF